MTDIGQLSQFPNLGVNGTQVAMVASAFAAQADIFDRFAGLTDSDGLKWIAQLFGLIGFTYIGIFHTAWRAIVILPWLILLMIMTMGTSYTGGNLFFYETAVKGSASLMSPIDPLQEKTPEEMLEIAKGDDDLGYMAQRMRKPADSIMSGTIHMFGPQIGILHGLNELHRDLANAMFSPGNKSLSGRMASSQALASARTDDYRVGYVQAMFRSACHSEPPSLFAVPPGKMPDEFSTEYQKWASQKITFNDFLNLHWLFYGAQKELQDYIEADDEQTYGRFVAPALLTSDSVDKLHEAAIKFRLADELRSSDGVRGGPTMGLRNYAGLEGAWGGSDRAEARTKFREFANPDSRKQKEEHFRRVILGGLGEGGKASEELRDVNVELIVPVAQGSDSGLITNTNWIGKKDTITDCQKFHSYLFEVTERLVEESTGIKARSAEYATQQYELCRRLADEGSECSQLSEVNWDKLSQAEQLRLGYLYAVDNIENCTSRGGPGGGSTNCISETQKAKSQILLGMASSVLRGDQVIADGILENASQSDQFRSAFRTAVASLGEKSAGIFVWFMSMFGGFAAGTYAAIMPMIVTWGLSIIIVVTPFLYLMGLIIPGWSLMIALTPLIGVLYLKSVEITFILIRAVFGIFQGIIGEGTFDRGYITNADSEYLAFYDLILGIAYTASFAISLFLLFGLKNPAGLAQQVGTSADKTAQISGQEALQIAGTAVAVSHVPKKMGAIAGSAAVSSGKLIGSLEKDGLISSDTAKEWVGSSTEVGNARADVLSKSSEAEEQAKIFSKMDKSDFHERASGRTKAAEEKAVVEAAHSAGNEHVFDAPTGAYTKREGKVVPETAKIDNAFKSLTNAANAAADKFKDVDRLDNKAVLGTEGIGGKINKEARKEDGTIAYDYNIEALEKGGANVAKIVEANDNASIVNVKQKDGTEKKVLQIVEHEGYKRSAASGGSGGGDGGGSDDSGSRIQPADKYGNPKPPENKNKPGGGDDNNT